MNVQSATIILTTLKQLGELRGMFHNLANVVFWSAPLSRMTVYRYLKKLEQMGYVETRTEPFRGDYATMYYITEEGEDYLERIKDKRRKRNLA